MVLSLKKRTFTNVISLSLVCILISLIAFIMAYYTGKKCDYCLVERSSLLGIGIILFLAGYYRSSSCFMLGIFPCIYGGLTAFTHLIALHQHSLKLTQSVVGVKSAFKLTDLIWLIDVGSFWALILFIVIGLLCFVRAIWHPYFITIYSFILFMPSFAGCPTCTETDWSKYMKTMGKADPEFLKVFKQSEEKAKKVNVAKEFPTLVNSHKQLKPRLNPLLAKMDIPAPPNTSHKIQVFLSFSMPDSLIDDVVSQFKDLEKIEFKIRGFKGSIQATILKVMRFCVKYKVGLDIDPDAFKKYQVEVAPTYVIDNGENWDKAAGNLPIHQLFSKSKLYGKRV